MHKRAVTIALIATTMSTAAMAADWVFVSASVADETNYVDSSSIRQVGPYKRAWSRADYVNDPEGFLKQLSYREYDCTELRYRRLSLTSYYKDGNSMTVGASSWKFVIPGSAGEATFNYVCFGKLG